MIEFLNSYYLNLFLLLIVVVLIRVLYINQNNYTKLVDKMNKISLTTIE